MMTSSSEGMHPPFTDLFQSGSQSHAIPISFTLSHQCGLTSLTLTNNSFVDIVVLSILQHNGISTQSANPGPFR
jgi:hypothetical protein